MHQKKMLKNHMKINYIRHFQAFVLEARVGQLDLADPPRGRHLWPQHSQLSLALSQRSRALARIQCCRVASPETTYSLVEDTALELSFRDVGHAETRSRRLDRETAGSFS